MCAALPDGRLPLHVQWPQMLSSVRFARALLVLQSAALGSLSGAQKRFSVWSCISERRAPQGGGQIRVRLSYGGSPTAAALLLATPFSSSLVLEQRGEPSRLLGFEYQEIR